MTPLPIPISGAAAALAQPADQAAPTGFLDALLGVLGSAQPDAVGAPTAAEAASVDDERPATQLELPPVLHLLAQLLAVPAVEAAAAPAAPLGEGQTSADAGTVETDGVEALPTIAPSVETVSADPVASLAEPAPTVLADPVAATPQAPASVQPGGAAEASAPQPALDAEPSEATPAVPGAGDAAADAAPAPEGGPTRTRPVVTPASAPAQADAVPAPPARGASARPVDPADSLKRAERPERPVTDTGATSAPGPDGGAGVEGSTAAVRSSESGARTGPSSELLQRVVEAAERMAAAGSPRRMVVEAGALRLAVSLQADGVRVTVLDGADAAGSGWAREVAQALAQRGLTLSQQGPGASGSGGRWSARDDAPEQPDAQVISRPAAAAVRSDRAGVRL